MQELRESGIEAVGQVPWGAHFCQFYQTRGDLTDTLIPYFKAGLESNEFCIWVTSDPLTPDQAREALTRAVPDLDRYLQKAQIEIIPHSEWYLKGGSFDLDRVLGGWAAKLANAQARGFTGMRVTGNTAWLERANWNSFAEYEAAINGVIGKRRMIALCTYSLDKCNASDVMDVISNHEFALMMKDGKWQMIENSAYKETRQALLVTEQKYQGLFNAMTEGFMLLETVLDSSGKPCDCRLLEANPAFEKLTGLSLEKAQGKTAKQVLPGIEDCWLDSLGRVALTGEPAVFESFSAPLNRWYEVYAYSPEKGRLATFFRDVTQRKQAEEKLAYLASFTEMNPMLVAEVDEQGNPSYLNASIKNRFPEIETTGAAHPYLGGLVEFAQTQQFSDATQIVREVPVGQRYYQQFVFKAKEGKGVRIYGLDITERKQTEEALRNSEANYRSIVETTSEGILTVDPAGVITFANKRIAEMLGYTREYLIGKPREDIMPPSEWERATQVTANLLERHRLQTERVFLRKDGTLLSTTANVSILLDHDGNHLGNLAMFTDITERKRAEEALRASEQKYRTIIETANEGVLLVDPEGNLDFANDKMAEMLGYAREELEGKPGLDLFDEDRREHVLTARKETWQRGRLQTEYKFRRKDGSPLWTIANISALFDDAGRRIATLALHTDITERKKAEEALRETTEYLQNLFDYANAPIIVWDPLFRITRFNHAFERLTGLSAAEVLGKRLDILFPEDTKAHSMDHIRKAIAGERWKVVEIPIQRTDGPVRVVLWNSANVYASDSRTVVATIAQGQDITERKQAEDALRETTDYLENLFGYANAPIIVWDPNFHITRFNRAFERLTGLSAAEVLGKQLDILFPDESKAHSMDHIRKAMAGERWEVVEIPIQRTDGPVRVVLWNSANVYSPEDGTLAATIAQGQDITERKHAESALREREEEVSAILENAPMLMLLVDPDRRVIKSNRAAAEFAGRRVDEMIGLRSGEALRCLHSLDDPRGCGFGPSCSSCAVRINVMDTIERRNSHRQVECRLPFVKETKTEDLTFLLYSFPLSMPQERTLICIQDITPLKKSEEAIGRLNIELTHRATQLESANRDLESFAYSVSHDLRAPLRSMEGFSLALLEDYGDKIDEHGKDYLQRIRGSSEMMAHLIDDILKLSRITRSEMEREPVDLSQIAKSIAGELRERDPKRHARFTIAKGLKATGDARLLRIAMINLLENAWKFTAGAPQARIEFGGNEIDGKQTYFVRDNGVGFDMAYVDKLFRPFQRLHTATEFPGTGIGLASVQRIFRRHGGDIWAKAELGKGATFFFTLGEDNSLPPSGTGLEPVPYLIRE